MVDAFKRKQLGDSIKAGRENRHCSQQVLATLIGTSKAHVWRIESGRVGTSNDTLIAIAGALDMKVNDLIAF